jgi:hypothetical protein
VPEHQVGLHGTEHLAHGTDLAAVARQLTVDEVEEVDVRGTERARRGLLLGLACRDERALIVGGVPGAFRPVREDEQVDVGAGCRPLGERGGAPELDIVGVCTDRERAARRCDVGGDRVVAR